MIYAPHRLQIGKETTTKDEYGNVTVASEWKDIAECRCDDNGTSKQVSVNGKLYVYSFHIVYEGARIEAGTMVRVMNDDEEIASGEVLKPSRSNYFGMAEIWI